MSERPMNTTFTEQWTNNPLLNIEKATEMKRLRREVPLKIIFSREFEIMKRPATSDVTCSQPILGKWISDCDFPFLMETLSLADNVFKQEFPGIRLSQEERRIFARALESHSKTCARCRAKRAKDDQSNRRLDKVFDFFVANQFDSRR